MVKTKEVRAVDFFKNLITEIFFKVDIRTGNLKVSYTLNPCGIIEEYYSDIATWAYENEDIDTNNKKITITYIDAETGKTLKVRDITGV